MVLLKILKCRLIPYTESADLCNFQVTVYHQEPITRLLLLYMGSIEINQFATVRSLEQMWLCFFEMKTFLESGHISRRIVTANGHPILRQQLSPRRQQHCSYPADLISTRMRVSSYKNSR